MKYVDETPEGLAKLLTSLTYGDMLIISRALYDMVASRELHTGQDMAQLLHDWAELEVEAAEDLRAEEAAKAKLENKS